MVLNSLREGTFNIMLEAMAYGLQVMVADISEVSWKVSPGETGWLFPPNSRRARSNALYQVSHTSYERLCEMGMNGSKRLQRTEMDCDHLARRQEQVYLKVLQES